MWCCCCCCSSSPCSSARECLLLLGWVADSSPRVWYLPCSSGSPSSDRVRYLLLQLAKKVCILTKKITKFNERHFVRMQKFCENGGFFYFSCFNAEKSSRKKPNLLEDQTVTYLLRRFTSIWIFKYIKLFTPENTRPPPPPMFQCEFLRKDRKTL